MPNGEAAMPQPVLDNMVKNFRRVQALDGLGFVVLEGRL